MKKKLGLWVAVLTLMFACAFVMAACGDKDDETATQVALEGITANGTADTVTTSELTLTFSADPVGLTANNITLTGATRGALTGSGNTRTLAISAVTVAQGGNVSVAISSPSGINITGSPKTVAVNVAGANVTTVAFTSLSANGTANTVTTTALTLTFSADPVGLTASNITVTGATRGTLTGSGTTRTLNISNLTVTQGELILVTITSPVGTAITNPTNSVAANVASGGGQPTASIGISNQAGLAQIRSNPSGTFHLTQNIEITGRNWVSLGNFSGTFDGRGRTISFGSVSSIDVTSGGVQDFSFFNNILAGGVVENVAFDGHVDGFGTVGAVLARENSGTIRNVLIDVAMEGDWDWSAGSMLVVKNLATGRIENTLITGINLSFATALSPPGAFGAAFQMEAPASGAQIVNSYWDTQAVDLEGTIETGANAHKRDGGQTTAALQIAHGGIYSNWSTDIWAFSAGSYPTLKVLPMP
ncbi:MAG: hypothetical protein FWH03_00280 [Firmicutes bacterium]|nr:hypothetical protein [Bacillota bacterium]